MGPRGDSEEEFDAPLGSDEEDDGWIQRDEDDGPRHEMQPGVLTQSEFNRDGEGGQEKKAGGDQLENGTG